MLPRGGGERAGWPCGLAICDTSPPVFRQPPGWLAQRFSAAALVCSLLRRSGAQRVRVNVTTISTAKQVWFLGSKRHLRPSSRGTKCVRYSHPGRRAATRPARPGRLPVPVVLPTHAQIIIRAHHHLRRCTLLAPAPWLHTAPSRPRRRPSSLLQRPLQEFRSPQHAPVPPEARGQRHNFVSLASQASPWSPRATSS